MWNSNVNNHCAARHSFYLHSGLLATIYLLSISVEQSAPIYKNRRGIVPIVRHHQFHKTILNSKLLVYYRGYLIVSMPILTVSKMRTTRNNIPEELFRSTTRLTYFDSAIFHNMSLVVPCLDNFVHDYTNKTFSFLDQIVIPELLPR